MGTDNPNASFVTPTALTDWNNRKQITVNGAKKTADFSDSTFASGWSGMTGDITVVSEQIDINADMDGTYHTAYYDLGASAVNDEKWVLDFDFNITGLTTRTTTSGRFGIGLSSTTGNYDSAQDGIFVNWNLAPTIECFLSTPDSQGIDAINDGNSDVMETTGQYYIRIIRLSSTKWSITVYSDSDRTNVLEHDVVTPAGTPATLRYIKLATNNASDATASISGKVDNIKFYNNITTVENIPSQQTATLEDDFSSDNFTDNDATNIGVSGGVLAFDNIADGTIDDTAIDLTSVSNSRWTLRGILNFSVLNIDQVGDVNTYFGIHANSQTSNSETGNSIKFYHQANSSGSKNRFVLNPTGGTQAVGTYNPSTGVDYYWTLSRINTTTSTLTIRIGSHYGTIVEYLIVSNGTAITDEQYIKVGNEPNNLSGTQCDVTGTLDDLEFFNEISEVNPSTITDFVLPIKIQGDTDLQRKTVETLDSDFSSATGWSTVGSDFTLDTTDERIELIYSSTATDQGIAYDATSIGSTFRLDWDTDTLTFGTAGNFFQYCVGVSSLDENTTFGDENQDGFCMVVTSISGTGYRYRLYALDASNVVAGGTSTATFTRQMPDNASEYASMVSDGTNVYLRFYADKARTILLEEKSVVFGSVTGLRYVKADIHDQGATQQFGLNITKFRLWNGITNPVEQETATHTDDFSADAWIDQDTKQQVTGGSLAYDPRRDNTNDASSYDLQTILGSGIFADDNAWCLQYVQNHSDVYTSGNGNRLWFGISDKDSATAQNGTHDFIGLYQNFDGTSYNGAVGVNGGALPQNNTGTVSPATSTNYYTRISRINKTTMRVQVFTGGYDEVVFYDETLTIASTIQNLRYLWIGNLVDAAGGDSITGTIDDLSFWNGISSPNASGKKIVFTNDDTTNSAIQYPSKTLSYDPINGDYYGEVKIPTLTTGSNFNLYMYHNYNPSANPSYVPDDSTVTLVQGATNTLTQNTSSDTAGLDWSQADSGGAGLRIASGHVLVGKKISSFTVYMKYSSSNSSPAQNMVCKHFGSTPSTVRSTASETPSSSTLSTSYQTYTYNFANPVTIQADDHIMVVGDTDGGGGSWNFDIEGADGDANINFTTWTDNSSTFTEQTGRELRYTLTYFESGNREQSVYDSNYKAVYHLQGNSLDSTIYGNDGTDTSVDWEQQNDSVGLNANGSTTTINVGSDTSIDNIMTGGATYNFTINPKSDGEDNLGGILGKGSNIRVTGEASGFVKLRYDAHNTTASGQWTTTNAVIPLNETSICQIIYNEDSLDNNPIFIINGVKYTVGNGLTETNTPVGSVVNDSANNLHIGSQNGGTRTFDGLVDNVKLSDKIRPSSQAIATYNAEKSNSDILTVGSESTPLLSNVETNSIFIKTDTNKRFWYNGTTWVEQA